MLITQMTTKINILQSVSVAALSAVVFVYLLATPLYANDKFTQTDSKGGIAKQETVGISVADQKQNIRLESYIDDAPFLGIENNSENQSSDGEILHVFETEGKKPGNAIARLFKRIGDGLTGKANRANSKKNTQSPPAVAQDSIQSEIRKTVDDLKPGSDDPFGKQEVEPHMGFDVNVGDSSGFRVLQRTDNNDSITGLGVHKDWQNLSEVLRSPTAWSSDSGISDLNDNQSPTVNLHRSRRFSIDLINPRDLAELDNGYSGEANSLNDITRASPNLVFKWNGGAGGKAGVYSFAAVGRKLFSQGYYRGEYVTNQTYGWGVNLVGDWRFGGLNAGVSLAMGEGVDSVFLPLNGEDVYLSDNSYDRTEVVSVVPSLRYFFHSSQFQVALGRYKNSSDMLDASDTLDTIHLGYSWNAWNDSVLGVEYIDQKIDGEVGDLRSDQQIRFGIRRNF